MTALMDTCRSRWGLALCCLGPAVLLLGTGCAEMGRAPSRSISELVPAEESAWNRPLRLTRGPGAEFNADFHAGRRRLVYVSDRDGSADIFLEEDVPGTLSTPVKLAPHSARDRWPRLSPDGNRLLFVSTREDGGGDVWLLSLRKWRLRSGLEKLTTRHTADDQPCWHPDGDRLFYASGPSLGKGFDLWELKPGGAAVRLTEDGGQMPDCSPDGRYLAFVSLRQSGNPDLWVLRLEDGASARLTSGPELDLYPCWSADGGGVLFTRFAYDLNGDGALDRRDASSLFWVEFSAEVFAGGELPPVRQLTPFSASERFPRPIPGGFLFTGSVGRGNTDVFALGESGEVPRFGRASEFMQFARLADAQGGGDPHRRLLAWQNAAWAALSAGHGGRVAFDLPQWSDAGVAWLRIGRVLVELGRPEAAGRAFEGLVAEFSSAHRHVGQARIALLELERQALESSSGAAQPVRPETAGNAVPADRAWQDHLAAARSLLTEFSARAEAARGAGEIEEARELRETCAGAQLEIGRSHLARHDYAAALDAFSAVEADYPQQAEECARALLGTAEVYRLLDEPEAVRRAYLEVLDRYPELTLYCTRAAELAVDTIVKPQGAFEEKAAGLRDLVERYGDVPVLPALAQNYIGDLYYARKDYVRAVQEYGRTIERFPAEAMQTAAAGLAIGHIRTEQQDYERAIETFGRIRVLLERRGGRLYEEARRGYVNSLLLKAQHAADLDDLPLALDTYARLLDFDPDLVAAHRGLVNSYAALGRVEDAILRYQERAERGPRDHVAQYALALAYSYYGPTDWPGREGATRRRIRIDREALRLADLAALTASHVPYYHQLRGFLLSRLALATDGPEFRVGALDAHLAALGLSSAEEDAANYANLLFNVGEGYMLVDQPETAYGFYRRAMDAGFSFAGERGRTALISISKSATASGDYPFAIRLLERALTTLRESGAESAEAVPGLRREAEVLDRLALACHLEGDYVKAVDCYRQYAGVLAELIEEDPAAIGGLRRNLLRGHRNLAVNLYLAVQEGQVEPEELAAAYYLLREAIDRLDAIGIVAWEEGERPGLITIDVEVALGEGKGAAEFDVNSEKRLLYTYMARISAAAGDYGEAVRYLRTKVDLYPEEADEAARSEVLIERAVVWSQIGAYHLAGGRDAWAVAAYRQALECEAEAASLEGEAAATVSLGRAVLCMADQPSPPGAVDGLLKETIETHRELLQRIRRQEAEHLAPLEAALHVNLTALLDLGAPPARVTNESP